MKRFVLLTALLGFSTVGIATAQPRKAPAPKEDAAKAEPAKAGKPEVEKTDKPVSAAGDATAAPAGSDDLGAPPPKEVSEQKPETKPSPLTPAPAEFPSGVAKPPPFEYDK